MGNSKYKNIFFLFLVLLPIIFSLRDIITGSIPFWYDPARDFLLAISNLQKPRLIGPESGIPGIFYGPYWIWLISFGQLFSKDPRFVVFLIQTLPYFTIFPFILYKLTKNYGNLAFISLWILFILSFKNYTTYLWNPHLAPLLTLTTIYLVSNAKFPAEKKSDFLQFLLAGITTGLIANIHLSFGFSFLLSMLTFFIILSGFYFYKQQKKVRESATKASKTVVIFALGIFTTAIPFITFELRHGFQQIKAVQTTVYKTVIHSSDVVGQSGIPTDEIPNHFLKQAEDLVQIPGNAFLIFMLLSLTILVIEVIRNKKKLSLQEKKLSLILFLATATLFSFFYSSTNPVWDYHFIGVEILFLLLLMLVISKSQIIKAGLVIWSVFLLISNLLHFPKSLGEDPLAIQSLASKKAVVENIYSDSQGESFTTFVYSPAIYTYDFDYLFQWLAKEKNKDLPLSEITEDTPVYLIIPETDKDAELDFINYKTPNDEFETVKEWRTPDKTLILKRTTKSS